MLDYIKKVAVPCADKNCEWQLPSCRGVPCAPPAQWCCLGRAVWLQAGRAAGSWAGRELIAQAACRHAHPAPDTRPSAAVPGCRCLQVSSAT